ncbi:MAG: hypothetical protein AAFO02_23585 [Bacteroidota bacterium]
MKYYCYLFFGFAYLIPSLICGQSLYGDHLNGPYVGGAAGISNALSADGSRIVVGGPGSNDVGSDAGTVEVYEFTSGNWQLLGSEFTGDAAYDAAGFSVSISADGSIIAFGSPNRPLVFDPHTTAGYVRVFTYSGGTWTQLGSDLTGQVIGDEFGYSVALSADGSRIAIGAHFSNEAAAIAGSVRVYDFTGGVWTQVGSTILGDAAGDELGFFVSISDDGERIAVCAPFNDANGGDAGLVRVYELDGGDWSQVGSDLQ